MYKKILNLAVVLLGITLISKSIIFATPITVEKVYKDEIPKNIPVNILNNEAEPEFLNYVFIKNIDAPIREDASVLSDIIVRLPFNSKLKVLEKVESGGNEWYKVEVIDIKGNVEEGYISALLVSFRTFRFEEMTSRIEKLSNFIKTETEKGKELASTNTYRPNPSNENMSRDKDKYGVSADQNAKANYKGETIYVPDRSILSIDFTNANDAFVNVLSIAEKPLKLDKKVISRNPKIDPNFRKVIVIDLKNENQGIFEKNSDGVWELISYTLNKTGVESTLGFDTPKGYFIVPLLKYEMAYRDEENKASGIAKYAIRFSGGGYIHGTPINHEEDINRDFFLKEKDASLGTVSGTRKCIRNNEDHIKFLFDWVTNKKVNRKVNDQRPDENVMVIVF